jgi:hypothetical protein
MASDRWLTTKLKALDNMIWWAGKIGNKKLNENL